MDTAFAPATRHDEIEVEDCPRAFTWTASQFERLIGTGALASARVDLRNGKVIELAPQYLPHARTKMAIYNAVRDALREARSGLEVICEASVRIEPRDMPEPDVLVIEPGEGDKTVPVEWVRVIVEVCQTTHDEDLGRKPGLYAGAGIPEYWVADLAARLVHVLSAPEGAAYRVQAIVPFGEAVRSPTLGVEIATHDLD